MRAGSRLDARLLGRGGGLSADNSQPSLSASAGSRRWMAVAEVLVSLGPLRQCDHERLQRCPWLVRRESVGTGTGDAIELWQHV